MTRPQVEVAKRSTTPTKMAPLTAALLKTPQPIPGVNAKKSPAVVPADLIAATLEQNAALAAHRAGHPRPMTTAARRQGLGLLGQDSN